MLTDCQGTKEKKCPVGSNVEAKLDLASDEVVCVECGAIIEVSIFTKNMMRDRKDIIKKGKAVLPPGGVQVICDSEKCNKEFSAEVNKETDKVNCPYCETEAKINNNTIALLKENKIFVGATERFAKEEGQEAVAGKIIAKPLPELVPSLTGEKVEEKASEDEKEPESEDVKEEATEEKSESKEESTSKASE